AYGDMQQIISDVPLGQLIRNIHRLGAHIMVAVVFLHMMRTYFTASYKAPRQFIWVTGVILLAVTLLLSFSGYLLPWDQLAYWAVTIGSSMAEAAPLFGNATNLLLRGGVDIGQGTLLRFYLLHIFALPMLAIIFISIHYYAVRKQEISPLHELFDPASRLGKPTRRKIPFLPDQVFFEVALIVLITFAFIVINYFFWNAHLESHANPNVTPQHTKAPWYFLWLQGMLKFGDKLWFGLIWPPVIVLALLVLPYLDRNPSRRFADRKVALAGGALGLIFFGFLTYAGLPSYGIQMVGNQEILTEFVPIEGEGYVDHVPFDALPDFPVVYEVTVATEGESSEGGVTTRITDLQGNEIDEAELAPRTLELFEEFRHQVEYWAEQDPRFLQPVATLSIQPWVLLFDEEGQLVTDPATGEQAVAIKRAAVQLQFVSTEVDEETGEVSIIRGEDGTEEFSRAEQVDFIHRDSHEMERRDVVPATQAQQ
ncbi:MAG: cytochrome bc complex cytochrome b subunit, partial [Chloroflexota bacterium]|nr:cytochrome bc complex cytochrome b subunit [Chloroflexota bacterium]